MSLNNPKVKDIPGSYLWLIGVIFSIGVTYSQVLDNSKKVDKLSMLNDTFTTIEIEQKLLNQKLDYQKESQDNFIKVMEELTSTMSLLSSEIKSNVRETTKNHYQLENIKETLDEIKKDK